MNKKGFTLIELLVVVLIIGILAAIALPQYFRAVERSRSTEALSVLASLSAAMERGRLISSNGAYPTFDALDIEFVDRDGNPAAAHAFTTRNFNITFVDPNVIATRNSPSDTYAISKNTITGKVCCTDGNPTTCAALALDGTGVNGCP